MIVKVKQSPSWSSYTFRLNTSLLMFCAMGFTLLLVVALMERSVAKLLFNQFYDVSEDDIRLTFSALKRLVGVLPYTLGVLVVGSLSLSVLQSIRFRWDVWNLLILISLLLPMVYNIFLADTAMVVKNLENTEMDQALSLVKTSLLDAVKQHYIGLLGFFMAFIFQLLFVFVKAAKPMGD